MKISSILSLRNKDIVAVMFIVACTNVFCSKKKEIAPPGTPVEEEPVGAKLSGSFADKFLRLYSGQPFTGAPTATWKDTCWKGDRMHKQLILWSENRKLIYLTR